ncbi:MAG: hypothetical protein IH796_08395, partial [Deltaproteobacteria bacterium]|nr:hypothetical protein [Deltaproteobacteria bacterium]
MPPERSVGVDSELDMKLVELLLEERLGLLHGLFPSFGDVKPVAERNVFAESKLFALLGCGVPIHVYEPVGNVFGSCRNHGFDTVFHHEA